MNQISENLKELRSSLGLTQTELAKLIDYNQAYISKYEKGRKPPVDFIYAIYEKLGVNIHWLFTGEGEMIIEKDHYTILSKRILDMEERLKALEEKNKPK